MRKCGKLNTREQTTLTRPFLTQVMRTKQKLKMKYWVKNTLTILKQIQTVTKRTKIYRFDWLLIVLVIMKWTHQIDIEYLSDEVFEDPEKSTEIEHNEVIDIPSEEEENEPEFSLIQSNILYLFFISGALLCLALDVTVQMNRKNKSEWEL